MLTKSSNVMITNGPVKEKWDISYRATETNTNIVTDSGVLMTTKLRRILKDHGECVSISNSLVLEILEGYIRKSSKLKKLLRENEELKRENDELRAKLAKPCE